MKSVLSILFLTCISTVSLAQEKIYLDKYDLPAETEADRASYIVVTVLKGGQSYYLVKKYYLNDTLQQSAAYRDKDLFTKEGMCTSYYPDGKKESEEFFGNEMSVSSGMYWYRNGQMKQISTTKDRETKIERFYDSLGNSMASDGEGTCVLYENDELSKPITLKGPLKNGMRHGIFIGYLNDGTVYCEEEYKENKLVKGVSYKDGKKISYDPSSELSFLNSFAKYLQKTLRYPVSARRMGVQGKVFTKLIFNEDYSAKKAVVVKSISRDIDAEAVRVLRDTGFRFDGMIRRGQAFKPESLVMPLRFKLDI